MSTQNSYRWNDVNCGISRGIKPLCEANRIIDESEIFNQTIPTSRPTGLLTKNISQEFIEFWKSGSFQKPQCGYKEARAW